jgi:hypothetical protein
MRAQGVERVQIRGTLDASCVMCTRGLATTRFGSTACGTYRHVRLTNLRKRGKSPALITKRVLSLLGVVILESAGIHMTWAGAEVAIKILRLRLVGLLNPRVGDPAEETSHLHLVMLTLPGVVT